VGSGLQKAETLENLELAEIIPRLRDKKGLA
jgi:hypothetical protein